MLTSSFSSAARAKSRRSRGSRRFGMRGSRKRIAASVAVPCAYSASISSTVAGSKRGARQTSPPVAASAQLVGDDLHRRGEIERRVVGVRGNRGDDAAARELGVGQPRHLGAEHERDVAVRRVRDRLARPPRARRARAPRTRAAAPTGPPPATQPASAASSVATTARAVEHGRRARRERDRLGIGKAPRARPARAARAPSCASRAPRAPMLPGWLGATSTMRMAWRRSRRDVIGSPGRCAGRDRRPAAVTMVVFVLCAPAAVAGGDSETTRPCIRCSRSP